METIANKADENERIFQEASIQASYTCPMPMEIIKVFNSVIATLGNFSLSTGKTKAKKTFNLSAVVSAALTNSKVLEYWAKLPEGKRRILYVDTEQSKFHCLKVLKRILKLSHLPEDIDCDSLDFICLREYSPQKRMEVIDYALSRKEGYGLVVIDGIRDLMLDINSTTESVQVVNNLMRWSSKYMVHIHCVLHLNKADNNVRGHIGTEMINKAESVLLVKKSGSNPHISEVSVLNIRDKEFSPFAFRINDKALPELVENYVNTNVNEKPLFTSYIDLTDEFHHKALSNVFRNGPIKGYETMLTAMAEAYSELGFKRQRSTISNILKYLKEERQFVRKTDKTYYYNSPSKNEDRNKEKEEEPC